MSRRSTDERLEQMLADARAEQARLPELDAVRMQAVRARLLVELEVVARQGGLAQARPNASRRSLPGWLAPLAVAAVVALGMSGWWLGHRVQMQAQMQAERGDSPNSVPASPTWMDGGSLVPGADVVAFDRELLVEHSGRASWTLSPGSRARVLSMDADVLRISLDRGALEAAVRPSSRAESFVVQALGTEVSVHGTRFTVSLGAEARVAVTVSEGEVRVRPTGEQSGVPLSAGMRGHFMAGSLVNGAAATSELSGAERTSPPLAAQANGSNRSAPHKAALPEETSRTAATPVGLSPGPAEPRDALEAATPKDETSAESAAPAGSNAPGSAEAASSASAERALALATEHIQACFQKHTNGEGELTIEVSTRLILEVEPSGAILEVRINPPLAPLVDACVARDLASLNLGPSADGFQVDREIRLRR
jgi:ferric-dicitrate binding protein FerR (iron transport regulator)